MPASTTPAQPATVATASPGEPDRDLPADQTDPTTAAAIVQAAERFVTAYARPQPDVSEAAWWERVAATLTPDVAQLVSGVDPRRVTWTQLTGPGQLVPADADAEPDLVRDVDVPTDAGTVRVTVQLDQLAVQRWAEGIS